MDINECKEKLKISIEEFCNQNYSDKDNLLKFLESKFGICTEKFTITNSKSICNKKDLIDKICDKLCKDSEILFQMS